MNNLFEKEISELFGRTDKTDSFKIADFYGCRHIDVMRAIQRLDASQEFVEKNFTKKVTVNNFNGREYPYYLVTKSGFAFLTAVFRGSRAGRLKEQFILDYFSMKQRLQNIDNAKTMKF